MIRGINKANQPAAKTKPNSHSMKGSIVNPTGGAVVEIGDGEGVGLGEGLGLGEGVIEGLIEGLIVGLIEKEGLGLTDGVGEGVGIGVGVSVGVGDGVGIGIGAFSIAYLAADITNPLVLSIRSSTTLPSSATPS